VYLSHTRDNPFQALGHADLIEAHDGSWWLVCLGVRPQGIPPIAHLGRETLLAPVQWDDAGWPQVGQQGRLRVVMESPAFGPVSWEPQPERDDFDGPQLAVAWNFLGTPRTSVWSLTDRLGGAALAGERSAAGRRPARRLRRTQAGAFCLRGGDTDRFRAGSRRRGGWAHGLDEPITSL
jgi:xylan 1,4-beta-xylosidase